jgi:hypothetical protein
MICTDELIIVNYCHSGCSPLKNIMRLDQQAAFSLASELAAKNPETTAYFRFADFQNYYPLRMKADHILRNSFAALGGEPQTEHPLYFVLQGSDYLDSWFGNGPTTTLLLKNIPAQYISFTYGDSCSALQKNGHLSLMTKNNLLESIRSYVGTLISYMKSITEQHHYIEAQLWHDGYVLIH